MTEASDGMEVKHPVATSSSSSVHNFRQPPAVCPSSASFSGFPDSTACSPNPVADGVKGNAVLATPNVASPMKAQSLPTSGPSRQSASAAAAAAALASRTNMLTSGTLPVNAGAGPPMSSSSSAHVLEAAKLQQQLMLGAAQSVTGPVPVVSSASTASHSSRPVSPAVSNVNNPSSRDADGKLDSIKNTQTSTLGGGLRADSPLVTSRSRPTTPIPALQQAVHVASIALATPNANSVASAPRAIQQQTAHTMHSGPGIGGYVNAYPGQPSHTIQSGQRSGASSSPPSRPGSPTGLGTNIVRRSVGTPPLVAVPVQPSLQSVSSGSSVFTSALAMAGSTLNAPSSGAVTRAIPQSLPNDRHHFATSGMTTAGNVTTAADLRTNERLAMTAPAYYASMEGFPTGILHGPMPFPLSSPAIGLRPPTAIVGSSGSAVRPPGMSYLVSNDHRVVLPGVMDGNNGGFYIPNYVTPAAKFNQAMVAPKTSGATSAHLNNLSTSEQQTVRQTQAPGPPGSPTTNSSPRPGILLRKRTAEGTRKTAGGAPVDSGLANGDLTDNTGVNHAGLPAQSPDVSTESSGIGPTAAHTAPALSLTARHNLEESSGLTDGASPRKKQRKQGLVAAEDPLASNVPEPNHAVVNNTPPPPPPAPPVKAKESIHQFPYRRRMPVLYGGGYRAVGKVALNHFQRTSDVRIKEERKLSVGEFATQNVRLLAALNGRVQRICTNLDTVCEVEEKKAEFYYQHMLQKSYDGKLRDEVEAMIDLLQGNIQRSKAMIEQISEAKQMLLRLHEQHKDRVSELLTRFSSQKSSRKKSC